MPTGKTLLERMRDERDELDAAIRVVERMTGPTRTSKAFRDIGAALAMASSNGQKAIDKARAQMNPPPKKKGYANRVKKTRQKTAIWLGRFDPATPRPSSLVSKQGWIGPMVSRGYLEKSGDGYIRTAKAFVP